MRAFYASEASVGWQNNLVGADLTGLTADQFVGIIGIDVARIEQGSMPHEDGALRFERLEAMNPFGAFSPITGEAEQAVLAEHRRPGEIDDHEQRDRRPHRGTDQRNSRAAPSLHRITESRLTKEFKQKAGEPCES